MYDSVDCLSCIENVWDFLILFGIPDLILGVCAHVCLRVMSIFLFQITHSFVLWSMLHVDCLLWSSLLGG